jgi:hypothetical protein
LINVKYSLEGQERVKAWKVAHPYRNVSSADNFKRRLSVFKKAVPDTFRKKHGHKPKRKWTSKQEQILFSLAEKYRKSPVTIDWGG